MPSVHGFASYGRFRESLVLNLDFHGSLRPNKICNLNAADLWFPGDLRLAYIDNSRAGCVVRHAKKVKNKFFPLTDEVLLRRLRRLTHSLPSDSHCLFSLPYSALTSTFKEVLRQFNLDAVGYTLHLVRHGEVTFQWLHGDALDYFMLKGRWFSNKSCKH